MITNKYIYITIIGIVLLISIVWIVSSYNDYDTNDDEVSPYPTAADINNDEEVASATSWYEMDSFPEVSPTTSPTNYQAQQPAPAQRLSISFVDLPQQVQSGQSFTVKWQVTGPSGIKGEDTNLELSYQVKSTSENSSASSSSKSNQSFGSFTTPQTFESNFSFGGAPGTIELIVTARINGQILSTQESIQLVN